MYKGVLKQKINGKWIRVAQAESKDESALCEVLHYVSQYKSEGELRVIFEIKEKNNGTN